MSVMRKVLLWASTNAFLRDRATKTTFVRRSVVKFMPGERIEDAIEAAKKLKPQGLNTILTRLGENLTNIDEAQEVFDHYMKVIDLVKAAGLDAQISIKPTQLGYDQNPEVCYNYCIKLLERCEAVGTFFWLDMESSPYVDGTIALFKRLRAKSDKVGIAHSGVSPPDGEGPRRTSRARIGHSTREGRVPRAAQRGATEETRRGRELLQARLATAAGRCDTRPGALLHIATHDLGLQARLQQVIAERKIPQSRYEFAMLFGIQTGRQQELGRAGIRTRCLISYGEYWFPWYMRRLGERPANVWFVVKNMFR